MEQNFYTNQPYFGNWFIDLEEKTIVWRGRTKPGEYVIPFNRLAELREPEEICVYDWLVHLTQKRWITETDMSDFNTAFLYVFYFFGKDTGKLDRGILTKSIENQKVHLAEREHFERALKES